MRTSMLFLVMLAACAPGSDPEEELDGGGKADDPLRVEHGDYTPGSTVEATFTASATKHAWTFMLDGHGRMTLFTRPTDRDTVLYLFRRRPGGSWGHYIAKNDDFEGESFSQITADLDEGVYRILVTAGDEDVRGKFNLKSRCEGPGCTTEPMDQVDAGDCIRQARECVFDALGDEEELTRTQARARLDECLSGKTGESTGAACDLACAYEDAEPLCAATVEAIAYYSRHGAYCLELYLECVPDCETADGNIMI